MNLINTVNQFNQNEYQYSLYNEYLKQLTRYIQTYGNNPELSIKYYHINIPLSTNIDNTDFNDENITSDQIKISGTGIMDKFENCTWDVYEFFSVSEITPFTYQPAAELNDSPAGDFGALFLLFRPNPGDLFTLYDSQNHSTNKFEIFQITDVTYNVSTKDILPMYVCTYKKAPLSESTVKQFLINDVFFYNTSVNLFFKAPCFQNHSFIKKIKKENQFKIINELFLKRKNKYILKHSFEENKHIILFPYLLNNLSTRIEKLSILSDLNKPIDFTCNVSLYDYSINTSKDNETPYFYFYTKKDFYNDMKKRGLEKLWPYSEEEKQDETIFSNPIAFLEKDLNSGEYFYIDKESYYYPSYLLLLDVIKNLKNLCYCYTEDDIKNFKIPIAKELYNDTFLGENGFKTIFNSRNKVKKNSIITKAKYHKYFNFYDNKKYNKILVNDTKYPDTSDDRIINSQIKRHKIIGDFNLPTSISFQHGVQYD